VSSFSSRSKTDVDDSSSSSMDIRRLERFAKGASEFLRFVEFGGTLGRQYVFFNPRRQPPRREDTAIPSTARRTALPSRHAAHEVCGARSRSHGLVRLP
jgi:hypothetical protein